MEFSSGRSSTDPDNIAVFSGEAETHRGKWEMALRIQALQEVTVEMVSREKYPWNGIGAPTM